MRKLAILAAAVVPLLSGCVSNVCDLPTATFHWSLQDASGAPWGCGAAAVTYVDVYIGNARGVRFNCLDGAGVIDVSGFAPGTYPVTVEGVAADGTIYDRALPFNVAVGSCGGSAYYPVLGEANLNVDYHFTPDVCTAGAYMWFALYDEVAGNYISVVDAGSSAAWKTTYGCYSAGGGTPLTFPVPFGTYTLAWIQEVTNPLTSPAAVQQACVQPAFVVDAAGTANLPVTLVDNTASPAVCPAYP